MRDLTIDDQLLLKKPHRMKMSPAVAQGIQLSIFGFVSIVVPIAFLI